MRLAPVQTVFFYAERAYGVRIAGKGQTDGNGDGNGDGDGD